MSKIVTNEKTVKTLKELGVSAETIEILIKSGRNLSISELSQMDRSELLAIFAGSGESYAMVSVAADEISNVKNRPNNQDSDEISKISSTPAMNTSLEELGVASDVCEKLKNHGIVTLGDASNHYVSHVREWAGKRESAVLKIRELLQENGLSFKVPVYLRNLNFPVIPYKNIDEMSEEEKDQFLARPVQDIGISDKCAERLAQSDIVSVGDLSELSTRELRKVVGNNDTIIDGIRTRLSKFGIFMETMPQNVYYDEPKVERKDIADMNSDELANFKKLKLTDLGVSPRVENIFLEKGVKNVGEVISLDNMKLREAFTAYGTYKKFIERLAEFGVDKNIYFDRKFGEATIEKVDVDSLTSEEREAFFAHGLSEIGFSEKLIHEMNTAGVKTIGDLAKMSIKDIKSVVSNNFTTVTKIKEIMNEYGLKPVALTTKIEESKVEPFYIAGASEEKVKEFLSLGLDEIGIHGKFVSDAETKYGVKTIGDLIKLNTSDIEMLCSRKNSYTYKNIVSRLGEFGIVLAEPEIQEEKKRIITPEMFAQMSEDEKAVAMNLSVDMFEENQLITGRLSRIGVKTLFDLANTPKPYLRKKARLNSVYMQELETMLARYNIPMKDSSCFVVNGKVVSKVEDIKHIISEKKVQPVDIRTLEGEERERVLDTRLEDLGLHIRALDLMRNKSQVETIRDIMPLYKRDVKELLAHNKEYIERTFAALGEFGIEFEDKPRTTVAELHAKRQEAENARAQKRESCKTLEEFLQLSLSDIGFSQRAAKALENYGLETVKDLTSITKKSFIKIVDQNYSFVKIVKDKLGEFGLGFKKSQEQNIVEPQSEEVLSIEDKEILAKKDIRALDFAHKIVRVFSEQNGIKSFGELIELSPKEMFSILGESVFLYGKLQNRLAELGVIIPDYKEINKAQRKLAKAQAGQEVQERPYGANPPSVSEKEEKYYIRKMEHMKKYFAYAKARNMRQLMLDTQDIKE